jgi:hypothetical protein
MSSFYEHPSRARLGSTGAANSLFPKEIVQNLINSIFPVYNLNVERIYPLSDST